MAETSRKPDDQAPGPPAGPVPPGGGAAERLREFREARGEEPEESTGDEPEAEDEASGNDS